MGKVRAIVCGYSGSGKTTLCEALNVKCDKYTFIDTDQFLPTHSTNDLQEFRASVQNAIETASKDVVLFGTFCNEPYSGMWFPHAEIRIWLDVSLDTAIIRALDRQLQAIESGTNLYNFLRYMPSKNVDKWLSTFLNPHCRIADGKVLYKACMKNGFIAMTSEAIIQVLK